MSTVGGRSMVVAYLTWDQSYITALNLCYVVNMIVLCVQLYTVKSKSSPHKKNLMHAA